MSDGDGAKQELLKIKPAEVSLVDAAANEEEFLIVKNKGSASEDSSPEGVTPMQLTVEISKGVLIDAIARERADDFAAAAAGLVEIANNESSTVEDVVKQFDLIWSMLSKTEMEMIQLAETNGIKSPSQLFVQKMLSSIEEIKSSADGDDELVAKIEKLADSFGDGTHPVVMKETVEVQKSITSDEMLDSVCEFLGEAAAESEIEKAKKLTAKRIDALKVIVEKATQLLDDFTSSKDKETEMETVEKSDNDADVTTEDDISTVNDDVTEEVADADDAGNEETDDAEEASDVNSDNNNTVEDDSSDKEVAKSSNDELLQSIGAMFSLKFDEIHKSLDEKIDAKLSGLGADIKSISKRQGEIEEKISTRGVSKSASEDETSTEQEVKKSESIFSGSVFTPRR